MHRRAALRWIEEEAQHQKNIEDTTTKAISQLDEDADPHAIDDDWIVKFFDKCRLVSDDKMQDLWASVLAGEANCAGSYSARSLTTLADMDKKVATLFNTFCSLCVVSLEDCHRFLRSPSNFKIRDAIVPIIARSITYGGMFRRDSGEFAQKSETIYNNYGFGIDEFQLLSEYGLIQDDNTLTDYAYFWHNNEIWAPLNPSANRPFKTDDYQQIAIPGYCLSNAGKELFHITKRDNPSGYFEHLIDFLQEYCNVKIVRVS